MRGYGTRLVVSGATPYEREEDYVSAWHSVDGASDSPIDAFTFKNAISSYGEAPRVSIARALLKAKRVLTIGFGGTKYTWDMGGTAEAAREWLP